MGEEEHEDTLTSQDVLNCVLFWVGVGLWCVWIGVY